MGSEERGRQTRAERKPLLPFSMPGKYFPFVTPTQLPVEKDLGDLFHLHTPSKARTEKGKRDKVGSVGLTTEATRGFA